VRRKPPAVDFSHTEPPAELLRFRPSQPAPIGPYGRREPWRVEWDADEFAAWLRARAAWRDTHEDPLPGLPGRERLALARLDGEQVLVDAEKAAPTRPPEWYSRQLKRGVPPSAGPS
jgi:hypothetical protein